jgi:hypothetical protein
MCGERALRHHARGDGIPRARKGDEKRIALRIYFVPVIFLKGGAQEFALCGKEPRIVLAQSLQVSRRTFNVRKKKRDRAGG